MITASQNPMLMCADSKKENAAIKLNSFITNFSVTDADSFKRFNRASELHALALRSDSPENQLLNLWVALETIVPSKLNRTKAKINNIIDSVLPFLSLTYIELLTDRLTRDFYLWNRSKFNKSIEGIEGITERQRLLKLLLLPEHLEKKNQLFSDLRQFYLLRNRAHYFSKALSSTSRIASILEIHWQRVDWQIRRIYRTRNLIVHAGHTPSYINILITNIHDYLDIVLNMIGRLASDGDKINTIEIAFKYSEIKYLEFIAELKASDQSIKADNIDRFLLLSRI